jgi:Uma2 family endonuclease
MMMATARTLRLTPEEYLERERRAEFQSEYLNGEVVAMSGASRERGLISANVLSELHARLKGRPCEAFAADMRVKVRASGLYTYPDVVVACGELEFEDAAVDTLLTPTLIVEVLSPSTEAITHCVGTRRGDKFAHYRQIPSLQEYVLVSQVRPQVERFVRQVDGEEWLWSAVTGLEERSASPRSTAGCRSPRSMTASPFPLRNPSPGSTRREDH